MTPTLKEIAGRIVERIEETTSVNEVAYKMKVKNVSSLVVVDGTGKPVGLVTERDLVRKVCTLDVLPKTVKIGEIMSSPVVTINSEESPSAAANVMLHKGVKHLLILDKDKPHEIIGLITPLDLLRYQENVVGEDREAIKNVLDTYESIGYY
jgi:signal-transduction protein with cAMP-binding, CBS, and nucleotidyltransferase domain